MVLVRADPGRAGRWSRPPSTSIRSRVHEYGGGAWCLLEAGERPVAYVEDRSQRVFAARHRWRAAPVDARSRPPGSASPRRPRSPGPAGTRAGDRGNGTTTTGIERSVVRPSYRSIRGSHHAVRRPATSSVPVSLAPGRGPAGLGDLGPPEHALGRHRAVGGRPHRRGPARRPRAGWRQVASGGARWTSRCGSMTTRWSSSPTPTGWWQPWLWRAGAEPVRLLRPRGRVPGAGMGARAAHGGRPSARAARLCLAPRRRRPPRASSARRSRSRSSTSPASPSRRCVPTRGGLAWLGQTATEPAGVWRYGAGRAARRRVARHPALLCPRTTSRWPSRCRWRGRDGRTRPRALLPAPAPGWRGPDGERPPLVVQCHGGPTGSADAGFDPVVQMLTTRGYAVAAVDYAGSTGYGRAYRRALEGRWGEADVDDCVAVAAWLAAAGRVDGPRMAIRGASAGGFTALGALVRAEAFAAAVSLVRGERPDGAGRRRPTTSSRATPTGWSARCRRPPASTGERSPLHRVDEIARRGRSCSRARTTRSCRPTQTRRMAEALRGPGRALRGPLLRRRVPRIPPGRDPRRLPSRPSWPSTTEVFGPSGSARSGLGPPWPRPAGTLVTGGPSVWVAPRLWETGCERTSRTGWALPCAPGSPRRAMRPSTRLSALFALGTIEFSGEAPVPPVGRARRRPLCRGGAARSR